VDVFQAVVLGIVQGLTEFLPISSSGHLRIVPALFGWDDPGAAFTAVIQLGTMAAVLLYFWRDIVRITVTWARSLVRPELRGELDARMGWYIGLGTIPIGLAGLAFQNQIEDNVRDLRLIGIALIAVGLIMLLAERVGSRRRELRGLRLRDSLLVGCAQALALIPGVSRSGSTITAGMFLGFTREAAARFSFLLSIPAVVLSGVLEFGTLLSEEDSHAGLGDLAVATVLAFISGYAAIAGLLRFLVNHSTMVFVVYRVVLGVIVLALTASGAIS
jgi:undecaprenyl-diphosphatase